VVARYAKERLLASGWVSGERQVLGESGLDRGALRARARGVAFGFRPQFRGQTFGTFKFVLNAIYLSAARDVAASASGGNHGN
jgi:hypothetical protein